jgi:hypothetical protein
MPQHEMLHPEYVKAEEKVKLFPCSKCPYQAKTKIYLKSHEENHQFKPDYVKCRFCDFYLSTQPCMKRHESLHEKDAKKTDGSTTAAEASLIDEDEASSSEESESENIRSNESEIVNKLPVRAPKDGEKEESQLTVL